MPGKSIGQAIDAIIEALEGLDEHARMTAIKAACDHVGITAPSKAASTPAAEAQPSLPSFQATVEAVRPPATDLRSLTETKKPASAQEMAALAAYYLSELAPESERSDMIDMRIIQRYFKQAGYPLPSRPDNLLVNAKNSGYLDAIGDGKYRLNPVGYNLAAYGLPRDGSKGVPRARRKTKKPSKKLTKKK